MSVDEELLGVLYRTANRDDLEVAFAEVSESQLETWLSVLNKFRREEAVVFTTPELLSLESLATALSVNDPGDDSSDPSNSIGFGPEAIKNPQPEVSRKRQLKSERGSIVSAPVQNRLDRLIDLLDSLLKGRRSN